MSDEKLIKIIDKAFKYEKSRNTKSIKSSLLIIIPMAAAIVLCLGFVINILPFLMDGPAGSAAIIIPAEITIKDIVYSTELEELNLSELELNDSDIEPLKYMVKLKTLWLSWNNIGDISVLKDLTGLTTLILTGIGLGDDINADTSPLDIGVLKDLVNLKELYLEFNKIGDIIALENLTNLTVLSLHSNNISDISSLKNLTNLEELMLGGNQIRDVEILKKFTNLTRLDIFNNQISDAQIEELKNALPDCLIRVTGFEKINE
jgi:internalin A